MTIAASLLLEAAARPDPSVWVGPGMLGLGVLLAIGVATFLLWRNMNKQIRKVDFDEGGSDKPDRGDEGNGDRPEART